MIEERAKTENSYREFKKPSLERANRLCGHGILPDSSPLKSLLATAVLRVFRDDQMLNALDLSPIFPRSGGERHQKSRLQRNIYAQFLGQRSLLRTNQLLDRKEVGSWSLEAGKRITDEYHTNMKVYSFFRMDRQGNQRLECYDIHALPLKYSLEWEIDLLTVLAR